MKYTHQKLGFSFELPDDWRERPAIIPPTFTSELGTIQVKASTVLPDCATPSARKQFMAEQGFQFPEGHFLGDEKQNLVQLHDTIRQEGWLSVVRDGLHYEVTWGHYDNPGMQAAIQHFARTFAFPVASAAQAAVHRAEQMTPSQKAAHDLLFRGTSVGDLETILSRHGMTPVEQGESGTFYGIPKERGKWWQFWRR